MNKVSPKLNIVSIIAVCTSVLMAAITIFTLLISNVKADTARNINISITDSTQWNAIKANNEGVGNCHKRIDRVVDEQRLVNEKILLTLEKINKNVSAQNTVLKQLCRKVDGMKDAIEFLPKDEQTQNLNFR